MGPQQQHVPGVLLLQVNRAAAALGWFVSVYCHQKMDWDLLHVLPEVNLSRSILFKRH